MARIDDYQCTCGNAFEFNKLTPDERVTCPSCGSASVVVIPLGGRPLGTIVPMHRRSLTRKAGFVHSHGDRPAERGSVAVPANKGSF